MATSNRPAEDLLGETLDGGWIVDRKVTPGPSATGGNFSVGYTVRHPDRGEAFLKALDFSRALRAPDPTVALQAQTAAYNYEVRVLDKCRDAQMSRVVVSLAKGNHPGNGVIPVPYLIFERADCDVRGYLDATSGFDSAWALRMLHQVAVGLNQMHGHQIAHQDMKPSNVLMFGGDESKIGDVGRADYQGHAAPHEALEFAGDPQYAPPELLYGQVDPDWEIRRRACDLYHLGSLILFFFADASTTPAIKSKLAAAHHPGAIDYSTALPFIQNAFSDVADDLENSLVGEARDDLVLAFRELCDPDPTLRGHPKARASLGSNYSLGRYISQFNLLARQAEMGMLRGLRA